jgi:hypothetical protein
MTTETSKDAATIRLVFELARADHPRLYDDLIRFPKGTKRINRLRVLAYDGLLTQLGQLVAVGLAPHTRAARSDAEEGSGDVTNDTFAPSHAE